MSPDTLILLLLILGGLIALPFFAALLRKQVSAATREDRRSAAPPATSQSASVQADANDLQTPAGGRGAADAQPYSSRTSSNSGVLAGLSPAARKAYEDAADDMRETAAKGRKDPYFTFSPDLTVVPAEFGLFPECKDINLKSTSVTDLNSLKDFRQLESIDLSDVPVSDLSPLANLPKLRSIVLSKTQVSDLQPLSGLVNLECLRLDGSPIADIDPLATLANLQSLYLIDTQVSSVEPLKDLLRLENLNLRGSRITDVSALKGHPTLVSLELDSTSFSDLGQISLMPKLAGLNIGRTQVTDLEPIRTLTGLENLDISDCHVADLLPLLELPNLRNLDLARCKLIKRLKPMQVLIERLESLTIIGCELDDVPEKFCGRGWRTNNFVSEVRDHLRSLDCSAGPKTELTNSPSAVNAALEVFEQALRATPFVSPETPEYADSDYSHLLEAIIIAYLAYKAFSQRAWAIDVHAALRRWLPAGHCEPFFNYDKVYVENFRDCLSKRGKEQIAGGDLRLHYLLVEKGICGCGENSPF